MIIIAIQEEDLIGQIHIVDNKEWHVSAKGVKEYDFCPIKLSKTLAGKKWNTNKQKELENLLKGSIINRRNSKVEI